MRKLYDDDDDLRREFKDTFSGIHASKDLKVCTLARLLEEEENQDRESKSGKTAGLRLWRLVVPVAALFLAVFAVVVFRGTKAPRYLTQMEDGVFYEEVKLEDGDLHFVANRVAISITPNAGGITIGEMQTEVSAGVKNEVIEKKETAGGGWLTYQKTDAIKLPDIGDGDWSYIGKQKIYITVLDTSEKRCQAVFEKENCVYVVTGEAVAQKVFIDYLYQIVRQ